MKYVLEFNLGGLPKTTNGSHGSWQAASTERKKWRQATRMIAYYQRPKEPLAKVRLIITRCSSGKTDFDNRVIAAKPIVDGLVDAKIFLNDTDEVVVERHYPQEKAPRGKGKMKVRVEEVS